MAEKNLTQEVSSIEKNDSTQDIVDQDDVILLKSDMQLLQAIEVFENIFKDHCLGDSVYI